MDRSHAAAGDPERLVTIRYFAWVREKIGRSEDDFALPASVATIADLVVWLRGRGPEYEAAFARPDIVRAAIAQRHVKPSADIGSAREIAFFPPVTGG
ncbi:MAG: molybdopterin converting factor subunit 1 [Hyphomicrobium sp.]|nr:molybdopterin converting factor subunit 1 [Hyphomicrobium sp.]